MIPTTSNTKHVIPILVTLNDEEWREFQAFYPKGVLYLQCVRETLGKEDPRGSALGDSLRYLFKLKNSNDSTYVDSI